MFLHKDFCSTSQHYAKYQSTMEPLRKKLPLATQQLTIKHSMCMSWVRNKTCTAEIGMAETNYKVRQQPQCYIIRLLVILHVFLTACCRQWL